VTKRLDRRSFFASIAAVAAAPFVPAPPPVGISLRLIKDWRPLPPLAFHPHAFSLVWPMPGEVVDVPLPERFREDI